MQLEYLILRAKGQELTVNFGDGQRLPAIVCIASVISES